LLNAKPFKIAVSYDVSFDLAPKSSILIDLQIKANENNFIIIKYFDIIIRDGWSIRSDRDPDRIG